MKTLKMSLENIQGKMSRKEMRNIMAGSGGVQTCADYTKSNCNVKCTNGFNNPGTCQWIQISGLTGCLCIS